MSEGGGRGKSTTSAFPWGGGRGWGAATELTEIPRLRPEVVSARLGEASAAVLLQVRSGNSAGSGQLARRRSSISTQIAAPSCPQMRYIRPLARGVCAHFVYTHTRTNQKRRRPDRWL